MHTEIKEALATDNKVNKYIDRIKTSGPNYKGLQNLVKTITAIQEGTTITKVRKNVKSKKRRR